MFKKVWRVLNTPLTRPKQPKRKKNSFLVNLYFRDDFPEIRSMAYSKNMLDPKQSIATIRQLCSLYFVVFPDEQALVLVQDWSGPQPEYTLISKNKNTQEMFRRIGAYLPDGMIVIFMEREISYV